jgi:hypothetical protein
MIINILRRNIRQAADLARQMPVSTHPGGGRQRLAHAGIRRMVTGFHPVPAVTVDRPVVQRAVAEVHLELFYG